MFINRFLKKAAIAAIAVVSLNVVANAQAEGDKAVGVNLMIGTGHRYSNVGVGAKFLYNVTDPIRLGGELDFFLQNDYMRWWDFSMYGHYLFTVDDRINVFPAVGLGIVGARADVFGLNASNNWLAVSFGGGADFALSNNLFFTTELRLKIFKDTDRINFALGLAYKF